MSHESDFPWSIGVFDAHCHPTDVMKSVNTIPNMKAKVLTIMSTRIQDQELVSNLAEKYGIKDDKTISESEHCQILPAFGWHPWFSHLLYDDSKTAEPPSKLEHYRSVLTPEDGLEDFMNGLPAPRPLSEHLEQTKARLRKHPSALIGEIGVDKSFRVPENEDTNIPSKPSDITPGMREGRRLSPYRVKMEHQEAIMLAQFRLAGEMGRAVSIHGVAAHGVLFEALKSAMAASGSSRREIVFNNTSNNSLIPPRICLHSYSGSASTLKQYFSMSTPCMIFVSFSCVINFSDAQQDGVVIRDKVAEVVRSVPEDRILIESDLNRAGASMDEMLEEIARTICSLRNWDLEFGVRVFKKNWMRFALNQTSDG